ncbi:3-oxoacyl-[acyl-carrier protein] reductase [Rubritalea squalenifaciens DSM 18772]|uniref:3-oxoacyl-[acyl-carrier protein] reductase n=1 Tax=Rubritalea squalenifaciens DSM 18772 TaxID=1123071 RepID=A0A1M6AWK6_9BACT|nr:SDR family NAD(P)-dependent oxidoreductase [Rubritalea squalenifaciens]SHI40865.1 3-oxoacyl-[acyl-carrier protein] reductase [Rubritalea squalenifaciens DSM 18772]
MQGRVLITGGEGGLGAACAEEFRAAGWEVLAPGRWELDVSDSGSVDAYFQEHGAELDLLVCNAGLTRDHLLARMSEEDWDQVMQVNLKGAFLCAKAAARGMIKRRSGQIVFISSYSAFHPPAGQASYAAAKAGLSGLTKSLAQELGGRGVRVNLVVPGFMETKMTAPLGEEVKQAALAKHALGRWNQPQRVARFIHFLQTELPETSGQTFNLDSRIL